MGTAQHHPKKRRKKPAPPKGGRSPPFVCAIQPRRDQERIGHRTGVRFLAPRSSLCLHRGPREHPEHCGRFSHDQALLTQNVRWFPTRGREARFPTIFLIALQRTAARTKCTVPCSRKIKQTSRRYRSGRRDTKRHFRDLPGLPSNATPNLPHS